MAEENSTRTVPGVNPGHDVDADNGKDIAGEESLPQRSSNDGSGTGTAKGEEAVKEETVKPKDSVFKKLIAKIGLDVGTVMMMFKYVFLEIGNKGRGIRLLIRETEGVLRLLLE